MVLQVLKLGGMFVGAVYPRRRNTVELDSPRGSTAGSYSRRVINEERPHRRGHQVVLVHRRDAKDLLDRAGHVDLRVERAVCDDAGADAIFVHLLLDVGAHDIARAAVTVDVVHAILRVVFLDEYRRVIPHAAVADDVDYSTNGQVVIGLFGCGVRRASRVVAHDPQEFQLGNRVVCHILGEILLPDIDAVLIGDAQIELRVVLDRDLIKVRQRGGRADQVEKFELRL